MAVSRVWEFAFILILLPGFSSIGREVRAQAFSSPLPTDCSAYIAATKTVNGKTIGPNKCEILREKQVKNVHGVPYRRIEMAVGGCLEGFTVKTGPVRHPELMQFQDHPDWQLAQEGNLGPYYHGVSCYPAGLDKSGITLFLPAAEKDWNGKLYMLYHGGSPYPSIGEVLQPRKSGEYNLLMGDNSYAGLMIDKGYAVAYTRRASSKDRDGGLEAVLDDGTVLEGKTHSFHLGLLKDFTELTKNFIEAQMGRPTRRTYWYGKSGGALPGRLLNYIPGANRDSKGRKLFDGLLLNDSAGGWVMPTYNFTRTEMKDGVFSVKRDTRDHLVFDEAHKEQMAFQIDISHLAYSGTEFLEGSYNTIKRRNGRLLVEKGLAEKTRLYEIAAVSHADAGEVYPSELSRENLDLSGFFDSLIDVLDRWVEEGVEPPPTRSDLLFLGDVDRDRVIENPAIELPEIACPLGVYYEFPPGVLRPGRTGFAPYLKETRPSHNADTTPTPAGYDESWLELLNSKGRLLDMNGNGVRDTRESITQAWQRRGEQGKEYGTLAPGEEFTHGHYASCVATVASDLFRDRLLSRPALLYYLRQALDFNIGGKTVDPQDSGQVSHRKTSSTSYSND